MDNNKYSILLVDDEEDIIEFLSYNLKKEGYKVITANNGIKAIEKAKKHKPNLILMDVMMPEMDGIGAVREIRKIQELDNIIIMFLTARSEDYSQIAGFESGADDYVSKPIKPRVLLSRISAILRRTADKEKTTQSSVLEVEGLIINREKFVVVKNGIELILPNKEFKIVYLLASAPNKVFSRDEIFENVWDQDVIVGDRTIDVHIRKIREKLGNEYIRTVKRVGYKFNT
ncbi:MAG: response regulator transcription factor [Bacteroidales bacterium]|jgi:two-component system, OmpR family, alkaline phosphatase synthesis response regulator PhoP|nr:DNA-binding response regulator [Lentimicrobiaceae bacterium]MDG1135608.1 response regulator transcription factor [Bacteroidales bacterium]MDG1901266.1 response regulator transcription factor [Bacteroidales bacterium]MDG2081542.1 response regulator transcription factor [Bacteroidales bacterium]|tara:strand:+ start:2989 stop:3678 length:690 start_codon:yes stop_codon:yes gene_type:complete